MPDVSARSSQTASAGASRCWLRSARVWWSGERGVAEVGERLRDDLVAALVEVCAVGEVGLGGGGAVGSVEGVVGVGAAPAVEARELTLRGGHQGVTAAGDGGGLGRVP